jgi:enoyl-CoA hydratase/carnithine racemase
MTSQYMASVEQVPPGKFSALDEETAGGTASLARSTTGNVAILTLRHAPHNLLSPELMGDIFDGLEWAQVSGARALVLRSSLRHFSAGAAMAAFECHKEGRPHSLPVVEMLQAFDKLPIPTVASVNGVCVGGGFELALATDFIIAAEGAKIGSVEVTLGLAPLMGAVQRICERAGAARAKEMVMLGARYDARTLERWNIINRVVPDDLLVSTTLTIAHELANGATLAHASTKRLVSIAVSEGVAAADDAMAEVQAPLWRSQDLAEGIASLQANGPGLARFKGQ